MMKQKQLERERELSLNQPVEMFRHNIDFKAISERGINSSITRERAAEAKVREQISEKYEDVDRATLTALVKQIEEVVEQNQTIDEQPTTEEPSTAYGQAANKDHKKLALFSDYSKIW